MVTTLAVLNNAEFIFRLPLSDNGACIGSMAELEASSQQPLNASAVMLDHVTRIKISSISASRWVPTAGSLLS
jgi:hypothetical protein